MKPVLRNTVRFFRLPARRRGGFTLVESVIALFIALIGSIAFMSATIFARRQVVANLDHLYALQAADDAAAEVLVSNFGRVGTTAAVAGTYENRFVTPPVKTVDGNPNATIKRPYADSNFSTLPDPVRYEVSFQFTGWGTVAATPTNATLTVTPSPGTRAWVANEWVNSYVIIANGEGSGQIMRITGNTATTLTVSSDLSRTGGAGTGWVVPPVTGAQFFINNGKTCDITVRWGNLANFGTQHRLITRKVLVPRVEGAVTL